METDRAICVRGEFVRNCKAENAWQGSAGYYKVSDDPLAHHAFAHVSGPPMGFNMGCDLDRLLQTMTHAVAALEVNRVTSWMGGRPQVVVAAKHGNACGAAYDIAAATAASHAMLGDARAVFGGAVMANFHITQEIAAVLVNGSIEKMTGKFIPGKSGRRPLAFVAASGFDEKAVAVLRGKSDRITLMQNPELGRLAKEHLDTGLRIRQVRGGFYVQPAYTFVPDLFDPSVEVVGMSLGHKRLADLVFAWAVGSTSNSNTITIVLDGRVIANAAGGQDRVGMAELAVLKAHRSVKATDGYARMMGSVAYSDSFFPFSDGPLTLMEGGVHIIFATSGSIRDEEVREVCRKRNASLLLLPDAKARGFFGHG